MNNRKLLRVLEPGARLSFLAMLLFAAASAFVNTWLAVGEGAAVVLLYLIYRRFLAARRREIVRYLEGLTQDVGAAMGDSLVNFPLPMVILKLDNGEILWSNERFFEIAGEREHLFEVKIGDVAPGFHTKFLLEGKREHPLEISLRGRQYNVFGSVASVGADPTQARSLLGTLYWIDVTEASALRREYALSRPVTALVVLDNYEEIVKNLNDSQKSGMLAAIDDRVAAWAAPAEGVLRKFDRDRFLFLFEERHLAAFIEGKFSLLDAARAIVSPGGIPVTLSIGIGKDGATLREDFGYAALAIDMALSRGGDQAIIKNRLSFEFYGGRSKEFEKRTKVKSRVMANTLARLISDSSNVLIMGHQNADIDSVGAAVGVAAAVRKRGRKPYIVIDRTHTAAERLLRKMEDLPGADDLFVTAQTAMLLAGRDTLLIVVDTNRPELVESPNLLQACTRIALVDHHRRASNYIERVALGFHEPYASSASELVTELLQYMLDQGDLHRLEAVALLAGIALDTKNFTMHTGVRTFEAAAFLRGAGADTVEIKKLFQSDLAAAVARYDVVRNARMYKGQVALAAVEAPVDRTVAAQAADELLGIAGVDASIVLFPEGEQVMLSARSLGRINVQVVMEKLGGGGHQTIAGAQVPGRSVQTVLTRLLHAIDQYLEENPTNAERV
ncbi:MAG: DHH family phosphoesterase [Oscillospiraceae bacterium]|nr:DHH family phosphoesterase [Oscillospiraceae bacterium]